MEIIKIGITMIRKIENLHLKKNVVELVDEFS